MNNRITPPTQKPSFQTVPKSSSPAILLPGACLRQNVSDSESDNDGLGRQAWVKLAVTDSGGHNRHTGDIGWIMWLGWALGIFWPKQSLFLFFFFHRGVTESQTTTWPETRKSPTQHGCSSMSCTPPSAQLMKILRLHQMENNKLLTMSISIHPHLLNLFLKHPMMK